jgi:SAM-dependent methyltransferase
MHPTCPACASPARESLLRASNLPQHSCILIDTPEAARAFPRGSMDLTLCTSCGLLFNAAFEPAHAAYSARYEETQGFSPTFSAYARSLADRLAGRYDLRGKRTLEIGCGKGEFLLALTRAAGGRAAGTSGVGVDPAYHEHRLPLTPDDDLTFHRALFDASHLAPLPDFICCRHSLEHIADPAALLAQIASALRAAGASAVPVWFDIPDARRVLAEGAFWDVYYEHCNYFTVGSLARLFRAAGLQPVELAREYDEQYAIVAGTLAAHAPVAPIEDDLDETISLARAFADRTASQIAAWRDRFAAHAAAGRPVVLWGGGSKAVAFATTLGLSTELAAVVDINPHKQGKFLPGTGHPVVGPDALPALAPAEVVVMNPVYVPEIRRTLEALGLRTEIKSVLDA